MKIKRQSISYPNTLELYFGGLQEIAKSKIPFKCIVCRKTYWEKKVKDRLFGYNIIQQPILLEADLWKHIRKHHKEVKLIKRIFTRKYEV